MLHKFSITCILLCAFEIIITDSKGQLEYNSHFQPVDYQISEVAGNLVTIIVDDEAIGNLAIGTNRKWNGVSTSGNWARAMPVSHQKLVNQQEQQSTIMHQRRMIHPPSSRPNHGWEHSSDFWPSGIAIPKVSLSAPQNNNDGRIPVEHTAWSGPPVELPLQLDSLSWSGAPVRGPFIMEYPREPPRYAPAPPPKRGGPAVKIPDKDSGKNKFAPAPAAIFKMVQSRSLPMGDLPWFQKNRQKPPPAQPQPTGPHFKDAIELGPLGFINKRGHEESPRVLPWSGPPVSFLQRQKHQNGEKSKTTFCQSGNECGRKSGSGSSSMNIQDLPWNGPPVALSAPPVALLAPPVALSAPPVALSAPPVALSATPVALLAPPVALSAPPVALSAPPVALSATPVALSAPENSEKSATEKDRLFYASGQAKIVQLPIGKAMIIRLTRMPAESNGDENNETKKEEKQDTEYWQEKHETEPVTEAKFIKENGIRMLNLQMLTTVQKSVLLEALVGSLRRDGN